MDKRVIVRVACWLSLQNRAAAETYYQQEGNQHRSIDHTTAFFHSVMRLLQAAGTVQPLPECIGYGCTERLENTLAAHLVTSERAPEIAPTHRVSSRQIATFVLRLF